MKKALLSKISLLVQSSLRSRRSKGKGKGKGEFGRARAREGERKGTLLPHGRSRGLISLSPHFRTTSETATQASANWWVVIL